MSTKEKDVKDEPEYKLREAQEEAGLRPPASDAVKEAITYPQTGFPVQTPDGHVMATKEAKIVNAKGDEVPATDLPNLTETTTVLVNAEDGSALEPSSGDPMVMVAEGTNEADAKKAEKSSASSASSSKSSGSS